MTARRIEADAQAALTAINLHRIWWTILVSSAFNVAILAFNFMGPSAAPRSSRLAAWQGVDLLLSVAVLGLVHWLNRHPGRESWRRATVIGYLALVLAVMDHYYFVLLHVYGHMASYVLGVITAGVVLLLPRGLFLGMLLANHAIFCALLLVSGQPSSVVTAGILDGSCGVLVAGLAEWFLYRAKRSDLEQQRIIAERNRELQFRNEEMSEVMAITAHDLRSPLRGVKHLLDFAAPLGGSERLTAALRTASESCAEMLALIGRLLDAHAAGAAARLADEDLRGPFEAAAARAQTLADAKDLRVEVDLPDGPVPARIDRGALAQVLDNLLGNAVKFSPPAAIVTLRLFCERGEWRGEVRDRGPGIPEAQRESIFRKFQRGDGEQCGAGLGLFIARRLMEAMRGSVECHSAPGGGAIFRLRFAPPEIPA